MASQTILQHYIFRDFILPFFLVFAVVFAVLEKTKALGDDRKQVNSIIAAVIGLIFVSAVYPKQVVNDLVLFLAVSLIVVLVFLLIYGLAIGDSEALNFFKQGWLKWAVFIIAFVAIVLAVLWATGIQTSAFDFLFKQSWSNTFWTNALFIAAIVVALAITLKSSSGGK